MEKITLGSPIEEGGYRVTYEVAGNPRLCAKILKNTKTSKRKDLCGASCARPMWLHSMYTFGTARVNEMELAHMRALADYLQPFMPDMTSVRLAQTDRGQTALVMARITNTNGTPAKNLQEHGPVADEIFWQEVEQLINTVIENDVRLYDFNHKNLMVRYDQTGHMHPVLVDFKIKLYLLQPLLQISRRARIAKIMRHLNRQLAHYKRPAELNTSATASAAE